jgi:predicted RNA-binding protein with RPS1 domain
MKKLITTIVVLTAGLWLAACTEPATDAEIGQMCEHLIKLGGEFDATPAEVRVAKVEADFADQLKQLETSRDEAIKAIDTERDGKLAAVTKEEEKAPITTEYDGKKAAKTTEFQGMIDKLNADKGEAVKKAQELAKSDADAAKAAVDKCVAENKGAGLSKPIAQCRMAVATTDEYWNKCK